MGLPHRAQRTFTGWNDQLFDLYSPFKAHTSQRRNGKEPSNKNKVSSFLSTTAFDVFFFYNLAQNIKLLLKFVQDRKSRLSNPSLPPSRETLADNIDQNLKHVI
jgi:hypothetical protein